MSGSNRKERPILFSGPMVRAILEGRKTQTRRLVSRNNSTASGHKLAALWDRLNLQGVATIDGNPSGPGGLGCGQYLHVPSVDGDTVHRVRCDTEPGDRLWVRETWAVVHDHAGSILLSEAMEDARNKVPSASISYRADANGSHAMSHRVGDCWRPSIHMPRWASRLTLEVKAVRVERLQEISEADAVAEGCITTEIISGYDGSTMKVPAEIPDPSGVGEMGWDTARDWYADLWDSLNAKRGLGWEANPWVWVREFARLEG